MIHKKLHIDYLVKLNHKSRIFSIFSIIKGNKSEGSWPFYNPDIKKILADLKYRINLQHTKLYLDPRVTQGEFNQQEEFTKLLNQGGWYKSFEELMADIKID